MAILMLYASVIPSRKIPKPFHKLINQTILPSVLRRIIPASFSLLTPLALTSFLWPAYAPASHLHIF